MPGRFIVTSKGESNKPALLCYSLYRDGATAIFKRRVRIAPPRAAGSKPLLARRAGIPCSPTRQREESFPSLASGCDAAAGRGRKQMHQEIADPHDTALDR